MLLILLILVFMPCTSAQTYFVKPHNSSSSNCSGDFICRTLDQYVLQGDVYFTTGSHFIFLPGNHSLNHKIHLNRVFNITLQGKDITIIWKDAVAIECENVQNLKINGMAFVHDPLSHTKDTLIIFALYSQVKISDSLIQGNEGWNNPWVKAIYAENSSIAVINCKFDGLTASKGGAVTARFTNLFLTGSIFERNRAEFSGGAVFAFRSSIILEEALGNTFTHNSATEDGGAIFCEDCMINLTTSNNLNSTKTAFAPGTTYISYNKASMSGGALHIEGSSMVILNGTLVIFKENSAKRYGGSVHITDTSKLTTNTLDLQFINNRAQNSGGAIYSWSSFLTLGSNFSSINFSNNSANIHGGAIYGRHSKLSLSGICYFSNNKVSTVIADSISAGGAISLFYGEGLFSISGFIFFYTNEAYMGGALYISYSDTSLQGTAIFEKNSAEEGGGICMSFSRFEADTAQVHFISNTAKNKGGAVYAIFVREYSRSILLTANFTRNRAKCGGAIYAEGNDNISLIDTQATGNFGSALCITDCNITFGGSTLVR